MSWKSRVKHVIFIIFLGIFIYSTVMLGYWLESIRQKSRYTNEVIADTNDIILTLSTCSYEFKDARFVVHGKLIK